MIAVITDVNVGGTFLTWTLYYLSGRSEYYHAKTQSVLQVTDSPLTKVNAHNFRPNQLIYDTDIHQLFPLLVNKDEYVYIHPINGDTKSAVDLVCSSAKKKIVVSNPTNQRLYHCGYNFREDFKLSWTTPGHRITSADEAYEDITEYFFKESKDLWKKENLTNVWDKREFIALNFDINYYTEIMDYIDRSTVYYHLHTSDLWNTFNTTVREVFEYAELKIDETRFNSWVSVYQQWKSKHYNRLRFVWYFDTIVEYILNGTSFDLERFNLDIQQEAAIQRVLIYKYNLNLRTWQLSKFTNTKQLHDLLEPNTHDLSKSNTSRLTA